MCASHCRYGYVYEVVASKYNMGIFMKRWVRLKASKCRWELSWTLGLGYGDLQPVVEAVPGHSHQTAKFGKLWRGSASRTSLLTSLTMTRLAALGPEFASFLACAARRGCPALHIRLEALII
jgi:hypothetical protein